MLTCKLDGDILEVTERIMSFSDTKVTYWYYDVKNWLRSRTGKQDELPTETMPAENIAWVEKYYLPKARESHKSPVLTLNPDYDPKAKARYAKTTAGMEKDNYYESHSREECRVEWGLRYDALKSQGG